MVLKSGILVDLHVHIFPMLFSFHRNKDLNVLYSSVRNNILFVYLISVSYTNVDVKHDNIGREVDIEEIKVCYLDLSDSFIHIQCKLIIHKKSRFIDEVHDRIPILEPFKNLYTVT